MSQRKVFRSRGPHSDAWIAAFFGFALLGCSILTLSSLSWTIGVGVVTLVGAFGVLASAGYSAWGSVELERSPAGWNVTYRLGRWSRKRQFGPASIHHITYHSQSAPSIPTISGRHVWVYLVGREDPVRIGGGLCLEEQELQEIETFLNTELARP